MSAGLQARAAGSGRVVALPDQLLSDEDSTGLKGAVCGKGRAGCDHRLPAQNRAAEPTGAGPSRYSLIRIWPAREFCNGKSRLV